MTADADIVAALQAKHVAPVIDALKTTFYVSEPMILEAIRNESCFNLIHLATMFKVDIFVAKTNPFRLSALSRVRRDVLGDAEPFGINLASPEDVVLAKLNWFREGGAISERQLSDVRGVLRLQAKSLDWNYLRLWAEKLNVADLLDQVKAETDE